MYNFVNGIVIPLEDQSNNKRDIMKVLFSSLNPMKMLHCSEFLMTLGSSIQNVNELFHVMVSMLWIIFKLFIN